MAFSRVIVAAALLVCAATAAPTSGAVAKEGAAVAEDMALVQAGGNGWGYSFAGAAEELKHSFVVCLLGIVMCCIAFPCLYWNEGRAVTREVVLIKAREEAKDIGDMDASPDLKSENNEKLVRLHGRPTCTAEQQKDDNFGVASESSVNTTMRIHRQVELYMWRTVTEDIQVKTGRYDSNGDDVYETKTIIKTPKKEWTLVPENWSSLPDFPAPSVPHDEDKSRYINTYELHVGSHDFVRGDVMMGKCKLTNGMKFQEIEFDRNPLTPDIDGIKAFVADPASNQLTSADLEGDAADLSKNENEQPNDDAETTQLLVKGGDQEVHTDFQPVHPLCEAAKREIAANLNARGKYAYVGANPQTDDIGDIRISWESHTLPMEGAKTQVHTIMARQTPNGALKNWIPDGVDEFHLDSCCKCVCCIGYLAVQDPEEGGVGCTAMIDKCMFKNASSDGEEHKASDNVRTVEKCIAGNKTVDDIVSIMEDANSEKTWFYRKLGFLLMFLGFQFVMDPIPTLFHFIPFIGHAIGFMVAIATCIVACALGCFGSISTISFAWLRYRPLWGILGIVVSGGIAVGICMIKH